MLSKIQLLALIVLFKGILAGELYFHIENARAIKNDFYICAVPFKIEQDEIYVNEIVPKADEERVHHLCLCFQVHLKQFSFFFSFFPTFLPSPCAFREQSKDANNCWLTSKGEKKTLYSWTHGRMDHMKFAKGFFLILSFPSFFSKFFVVKK